MGFNFVKKEKTENQILTDKMLLLAKLKELDDVSEEMKYLPKNEINRKNETLARLHKKLLQKKLNEKKSLSF